jgi:hypothetical protein
MHGEGVWHPTTSVRRRLPPSMCSCVRSIKCWIIIRYKCLDVVGRTSIGATRISTRSVLLSFVPLRLSVYLLGFPVKQWQCILETLTLFTRKKFDWFGHDQDLICPWVARTK